MAFADVPKEKLLALPKEELVDMLLMALKAQEQTTQNMQVLSSLLETAAANTKGLESRCASLEAELIALRNKP